MFPDVFLYSGAYQAPYFLSCQVFSWPSPAWLHSSQPCPPSHSQSSRCYTHTHTHTRPSSLCLRQPRYPLSLPGLQAPSSRQFQSTLFSLFSACCDEHTIFSTCLLSAYCMPEASLVSQAVENLPARQETCARSLGWEDSPEMGMATPLQYSCLENFMDRGAWWATVRGVAKSRT